MAIILITSAGTNVELLDVAGPYDDGSIIAKYRQHPEGTIVSRFSASGWSEIRRTGEHAKDAFPETFIGGL